MPLQVCATHTHGPRESQRKQPRKRTYTQACVAPPRRFVTRRSNCVDPNDLPDVAAESCSSSRSSLARPRLLMQVRKSSNPVNPMSPLTSPPRAQLTRRQAAARPTSRPPDLPETSGHEAAISARAQTQSRPALPRRTCSLSASRGRAAKRRTKSASCCIRRARKQCRAALAREPTEVDARGERGLDRASVLDDVSRVRTPWSRPVGRHSPHATSTATRRTATHVALDPAAARAAPSSSAAVPMVRALSPVLQRPRRRQHTTRTPCSHLSGGHP